MVTNDCFRVQGRSLTAIQVVELQHLIDEHPDWSRHRVAKEICIQWLWQTPTGQLKTFAARSLLMKLVQKCGLRLPPILTAYRRSSWGLSCPQQGPQPEPASCPIEASLSDLQPLRWHLALHGSKERAQALAYLRNHHYLGCNRPVGTHLIYLVQDVRQRDLAVHLVGAAAWQCAGRDEHIGWSAGTRAQGLQRIANHSRFLILPWVRVPQLASHLLGGLTRRISGDWQRQHGWRLELLETFVETGRFSGVAYRAANWQPVGQTTGRTRQEKFHRPTAPPKSVWVCALDPHFRRHLGIQSNDGGEQ